MDLLYTQTSPILVLSIFFITLIIKRKLEIGLDTSQIHQLEDEFYEVPDDFKESIGPDQYKRSQEYNIKKLKAKKSFGILGLFILLLWTLGSGLNLLYNLLSNYIEHPLLLGLIYLLAFFFINMLFSLPYRYYKVFVIEENFNLNKMTRKQFALDILKSFTLEILLLTPLLSLLLFFLQNSTLWYFYSFLIVSGFIVFMQLIAPLLLPLFYKFKKLENREILEKTILLFSKENIKCNTPLIMNASSKSTHANAFFYGLLKTKNIVFYDSLLKLLSPDEIESVLLHEVAHLKYKHHQKLLCLQIIPLFFLFFIFSLLYQFPAFYLGHGVYVIEAPVFIALLATIVPIYSFFFLPLFHTIQRKYEYEADNFVKSQGKASFLVSALLKLSKNNLSILSPHPNFVRYYYSHPPLSERFKNLK